MDCIGVLPFICEYQKEDTTFIPVKNSTTSRWNVNSGGKDFELLITGTKWFDTRAQKGGGGAVDLVMHLLSLDFVGAVKFLKKVIE